MQWRCSTSLRLAFNCIPLCKKVLFWYQWKKMTDTKLNQSYSENSHSSSSFQSLWGIQLSFQIQIILGTKKSLWKQPAWGINLCCKIDLMYGKQRQWAKKRWYKPGALPGALTETAHKSDRDITTQEIKSYPKCTTLWSKCFSLSNIYAFFYTRITLPKMYECTFRKPVAQQWIWKLMLSNTLRLAAWNSLVFQVSTLWRCCTRRKNSEAFFKQGRLVTQLHSLCFWLLLFLFLCFPKNICLLFNSSVLWHN